MTQPHSTIFVLDGSGAVTGAFISARDMARTLRDSAEVILLLPNTSCFSAAELVDFAAVYRLPVRHLRRNFNDALFYLPDLLRATLRLRNLLGRHQGAVLLVNDFYLMHGPLLRIFGYRGPVITWVRIDPAAFGWIGWLWLSIAGQFSNKIIAVSQHVLSLLPAKMTSSLLYDPVSAEFLHEPRARASDSRDFVFLGNYIEGKGQDTALEAFALLLPDVPQARLRFYGGDMGLERNRAYRRSLVARASSLGISGEVSFGDFVAAPRAVLESAFAALNLSKSESFSRTALEASASGLPVIATCSGGPAEIVKDGETGLMIPVGDVAACASAMRTLCSDPTGAARMGAAGRNRVIETFAPNAFANRLRALIYEVT